MRQLRESELDLVVQPWTVDDRIAHYVKNREHRSENWVKQLIKRLFRGV